MLYDVLARLKTMFTFCSPVWLHTFPVGKLSHAGGGKHKVWVHPDCVTSAQLYCQFTNSGIKALNNVSGPQGQIYFQSIPYALVYIIGGRVKGVGTFTKFPLGVQTGLYFCH